MHSFTTYNDQQLLGLLKEGQEPALAEIYARYWESLYARVSHFLDNEDLAKDCVQDVFIALWRHPDKTAIQNLDHYLHQSVRFRALKAIRDLRSHTFQLRVENLENRLLTENTLEYKELKALLEHLIASLPDDQREIFLLHREHQLTYNQIAEKLGISVKTVEKKMSRSLQQLRSRLPDSLHFILFLF